MAAEAYLIHSDSVIVGMGGFSGQDPAPNVATLTRWVSQGQVRFVIGHDIAGRGSRWGVATQRAQWVQQRCTVVDPGSYGASAPARAGAFNEAEVLYDCQAAH
jgi:hypothetical protein